MVVIVIGVGFTFSVGLAALFGRPCYSGDGGAKRFEIRLGGILIVICLIGFSFTMRSYKVIKGGAKGGVVGTIFW